MRVTRKRTQATTPKKRARTTAVNNAAASCTVIGTGATALTAPPVRVKWTPADYKHDGFDTFRDIIQQRVTQRLSPGEPVFRTDVKGLFDKYLRALPRPAKSYCNCNTCRKFFDEYAGLVTVNNNGTVSPLLWSSVSSSRVPVMYQPADSALYKAVRAANITGIKIFDRTDHGVPTSPGGWTHYAFTVPQSCVKVSRLKKTHEIEAEKNQQFQIVSRALSEWSPRTLATAVDLLKTDYLSQAEKVLGPVKWLHDLQHNRLAARTARGRNNFVWRAVALASDGFCHPRSAVTASLLDDIEAGKPFETIKRTFAAKMHPLQYQRPQAAPKAGNILAATRAFSKLGLDESLQRRTALLAEVTPNAFWRPTPVHGNSVHSEVASGPFAGVASRTLRGTAALPSAPLGPMTWRKFERDILPTAARISLLAESGPYYGITTAVNMSAPPIIAWDKEDDRNPYAWYTYVHGSAPTTWGLPTGAWVEVLGITPRPCHWKGDWPAFTEAAFFLLPGARDRQNRTSALFPEVIHNDLHPYRATIERYSQTTPLRTTFGVPACAWVIDEASKTKTLLRVTTRSGLTQNITIDRWE